MTSTCLACGHPRARHFRDVDGIIRCLVTESGVSTSGVIGLPWESLCDCTDFRSEAAELKRAATEAERQRHQELVDRITGLLP